MSKKENELAVKNETQVDDLLLLEKVSSIIETRKARAGAYANSEVTLMYWKSGSI